MKACVMTAIGTPWQMQDLAKPKPQPGQVLIKIKASGMCYTDYHIHCGHVPSKVPLILGHEPVGEIVELGLGVTDLAIGDRVGVCWNQKGCGRCPYCQKQKIAYCSGLPHGAYTWMDLGGGNAEYMLAWEDGCTLIPDGLSYEHAAPMFCAGFTIASGYFNADPKPGERIAVLGVGGLGHIAIQYAKAKGHEVIAVTSSQDKVALAKKLGADDVVVSKDSIGKDLMSKGGVDIVLHTSNSSKDANDSIMGLRPEGRIVCMGLDTTPISIEPYNLAIPQRKIIGSIQNRREDLVDILSLAAQKRVTPMIEVFPLEEANAVLKKLSEGKIRFRAVLTP